MRLKRSVAFILSILLLVTSVPATALITFASESTEATSSCIKSFSIDKTSLVEGDSAIITMETEGEYYPWYVSYYKPITGNTKTFSFLNLSGNTYVASITVDEQTEAGEWEIRSITFRNSDSNSETVYNSTRFSSLTYDKVDFSALSFQVSGTNADITSPVLTNFGIDKNAVAIGESVSISLKIEEEKPVDNLTIVYLSPSGEKKWVYLTIQEKQDLNVVYTVTIDITDEYEYGLWQPYYIYLKDVNDNSSMVYNTNVYSLGNSHIDLSSMNYEVTHVHQYADEWTMDVQPTCTTEGSKSRHCLLCDKTTDVTTIERTHVWNNSYTIDKNATCTEEGSKSIHCMVCDEIKDVTVVSAKGHSWDTDEKNNRSCVICGYSELISDSRDILYEQICTQSKEGSTSVSFGNLSSNGYHYLFEVSENSFFAQYKTKDSNWTKVISFRYDYLTGTVTSNFTQVRSSNYYAATATFNASDYLDVDSIVYQDATGGNYGGMCVTYAEKFAAIAMPKLNQKMMDQFGVSLYKIGFTSYSHTHSGGEATCCSYAVCNVCDKGYGELKEHVTEIVNQVYATCYEPGYTGDRVCTVCDEIIEYGESIPIIEREVATGKFDLLKQYILKYGKTDAAGNKYIYYSDVIYDTNSNPIHAYARITYLDEFAKFRLMHTSGEDEELIFIIMDLNENGSDNTVVEFAYEELGLYADAPINVKSYEMNTNIYFERVKDFILSNEQIQNLCNAQLRAAIVAWDILLLEHFRLDLNMGNLGFVSYETPASDMCYGDSNGDRTVDGRDVITICNYLANFDYDTGTSNVAITQGTDANGDGSVDGRDVIIICNYLANYDYETGSSTIVLGPQN